MLKPPTTQRSFANSWGELDYLCKKVRYWLYTRRQKSRASRYRPRLRRVLNAVRENRSAILGEEGLALLCELDGKIRDAIAHRKREISLMQQLHREAASPRYADSTRAYMLRDRGIAALRERRAILGVLEKAIAAQIGDATPSMHSPNGHSKRSKQTGRRNGQTRRIA